MISCSTTNQVQISLETCRIQQEGGLNNGRAPDEPDDPDDEMAASGDVYTDQEGPICEGQRVEVTNAQRQRKRPGGRVGCIKRRRGRFGPP